MVGLWGCWCLCLSVVLLYLIVRLLCCVFIVWLVLIAWLVLWLRLFSLGCLGVPGACRVGLVF